MQSFEDWVNQFEQRFGQEKRFPQQPLSLYDPCRYLLSWGGKRVRPAACLMANELLGAVTEDAWHAAVALELFHNFTLVHDDIMDGAKLRRGKATLHHQYGMASGILSGDVLCIYAYQELQQLTEHLPIVMQIFNKTAIEVCEGQQLDMDFEQCTEVTVEAYLHMIGLKTAALLAAALQIGAVLGGATMGNAEKLYQFGWNMGLAFQLKDDYLDAFGDERTGKSLGGDIMANKKTYLLLQSLSMANQEERKEFDHWLKEPGSEKIEAIKSLMERTGGAQACREAITAFSLLAFNHLDEVAVMSKRKVHLHALAELLLKRVH